MKQFIPNKLDKRRQSAVTDPLMTSMIAMRMGRANSDHYHDIAGALTIAPYIADMVPRHRPLKPDIEKGIEALNQIFLRRQQRTIDDAPWNGTVEELDAVETAVEIYLGFLRTTPGPVMMRAIRKAMLATGIKPPH